MLQSFKPFKSSDVERIRNPLLLISSENSMLIWAWQGYRLSLFLKLYLPAFDGGRPGCGAMRAKAIQDSGTSPFSIWPGNQRSNLSMNPLFWISSSTLASNSRTLSTVWPLAFGFVGTNCDKMNSSPLRSGMTITPSPYFAR